MRIDKVHPLKIKFSVKIQMWTQLGAESAFQSLGSKGLSHKLHDQIVSYRLISLGIERYLSLLLKFQI